MYLDIQNIYKLIKKIEIYYYYIITIIDFYSIEMNNKDYKLFEFYIVNEHQTQTNHITYHWDHIPHDLLYEAGFIGSYQDARLERLEKMNIMKEDKNYVPEYGLDAISYDKENNVYHGLQMKYWNPSIYWCMVIQSKTTLSKKPIKYENIT